MESVVFAYTNWPTRIHLTARLHSTFNVVLGRSQSLLVSATTTCTSTLVCIIFSHSVSLCYTSTGSISMYGPLLMKEYFREDAIYASIYSWSLFLWFLSANEFIIRTFSCNLVSYCITTFSLVCSAHYNKTVWRITHGIILSHSLKDIVIGKDLLW